MPHLRRDWAHPCHICAATGLTPATSAPGLGSPLPHLRRDWAHPCHICTGTGTLPPHLRRDWAHPCHICAGTGLTPATSARGLGTLPPHLRRDWAHRCHTCACAGTGLTPGCPAASAPDCAHPRPGWALPWNEGAHMQVRIITSLTPCAAASAAAACEERGHSRRFVASILAARVGLRGDTQTRARAFGKSRGRCGRA